MQMSVAKEEISRLQTQLQRAINNVPSTSMKELSIARDEEVSTLRQMAKEAATELDVARSQQKEQQLLYRRQVHELSAIYNRTKKAQVIAP